MNIRFKLQCISVLKIVLAFFVSGMMVPVLQAQEAAVGDESEDPIITIEYADYEFGVEVQNEAEFIKGFYQGIPFAYEDTLATTLNGAEMRIHPANGIARLGNDGNIRLLLPENEDAIAEYPSILLNKGRIRIVAPIGSAPIRIATEITYTTIDSADLILEYTPGQSHTIIVTRGEASFYNRITNEEIVVSAGEWVDFFGESFSPPNTFAVGETLVNGIALQLLDFVFLDVNEIAVDGGPPVPAVRDVIISELSRQSATTSVEVAQDEEKAEEDLSMREFEMQDILNSRVWDFLRVESGIVPQDGNIYTLLSVQPGFIFDNFVMRFNVSLTFRDDPFNTNNWYPAGGANNEWTFGTDHNWQTDTLNAVLDLIHDITLKIDYIGFETDNREVLVRFGALEGITFGHGILVNNFSNAIDLPLIRRQGFYLKSTLGFGFSELLIPEVADPFLFGARFVLNPFANFFHMGISAVFDLSPLRNLGQLTTAARGLFTNPADALNQIDSLLYPAIIPVGLDVSFQIFDLEDFSLNIYSEAGILLSFHQAPSGASLISTATSLLQSGFNIDLIVNSVSSWIRNFVTTIGVEGHAGFFEFRADFRTYSGNFRFGMFDETYLRRRASIASGILETLANPKDRDHDAFGFGIYVEPGFSFFEEKLRFGFGYYFPIEVKNDTWGLSDYDALRVWVELNEGVLPFYVRLGYTREGFLATILQRGLYNGTTLIDGLSTYQVSIGYSPIEILSLELFLKNSANIDAAGVVQYENGLADASLQFGMSLRIGKK